MRSLLVRLRALRVPLGAWLAAQFAHRDSAAEAIEYFRRESAAGHL